MYAKKDSCTVTVQYFSGFVIGGSLWRTAMIMTVAAAAELAFEYRPWRCCNFPRINQNSRIRPFFFKHFYIFIRVFTHNSLLRAENQSCLFNKEVLIYFTTVFPCLVLSPLFSICHPPVCIPAYKTAYLKYPNKSRSFTNAAGQEAPTSISRGRNARISGVIFSRQCFSPEI